jgi:very-short-patch-repair endonuclease
MPARHSRRHRPTELHHDIFCRHLFAKVKGRIDLRLSADETLNYYADLEELIDDYTCLMDECESPIEKIIGSELLFATDGYETIRYALAGEDRPPAIDGWGTYFFPQATIGGSRIDFLVVCYHSGATSKLAIECDGHDYHDKTKAQASRDKARGRAITASGIPVYRFTGSDIFYRSEECRTEIEGYISKAMDALLVQTGAIKAMPEARRG